MADVLVLVQYEACMPQYQSVAAPVQRHCHLAVSSEDVFTSIEIRLNPF